MNIDSGTAIVLVYVLVSMGVIIASLLAALATGWFIDRLRERRSGQTVPGGENAERGRTDQVPPS
jgi:cytochrome c oxidase assembly factor CtaG